MYEKEQRNIALTLTSARNDCYNYFAVYISFHVILFLGTVYFSMATTLNCL